MVTFATLFLGLVLGTQPVELLVGEGVAAVEVRLDGELLAVLREAPWALDCDFGAELAPHHLEAIAFDAENREIGRESQWINLPRPQAVATLILEPKQEGEPRIARLSWESAAGAEPESLTVTLDGQPLSDDAIADPHRILLPPVDERQFHILSAELEFEGRVSSRVDLTFGGAYVDAVQTEITALALVSESKRARPPSLEQVQGWFLKGEEKLRTLAVERGEAEIVIVVDRPFPHMLAPGKRYKPPKALSLDGSERFRFLSTTPEQSEGVSTTFDLFPISSVFQPKRGDMYSLLTRLLRPQQEGDRRPVSAVAVAGLAAYSGRQRRAVVLIPSSNPHPNDELSPDRVRRYLDRLGVPLFVWDPESHQAEHVDAWGGVRMVGDFEMLADALGEVRSILDRQWIVWLEGRHLPQEIRLSSEVDGFALLGGGP